MKQAAYNRKNRCSNSPDLGTALVDAIIDAYQAHRTMSTQALGSERVRAELKGILLGPAQLYEVLRARAGGRAMPGRDLVGTAAVRW